MDRAANPVRTGRRGFLGAMGAAGAVLLTLAGAGPARAVGPARPADTGKTAPVRDGGYRETAHVRRFYAAARDGDRAGRK